MPTFLTTARMNPALAARVEASVTGRRGVAPSRSVGRRFVSWARLLIVVVAAVAITSGVSSRRRNARALARARAELLDRIHTESASLTPDAVRIAARVEPWIAALAAPSYEGDLVAAEMKVPGGLAAVLARPLVYVRGPRDALANAESRMSAAAASTKDALLFCLVAPPTSRAESALLERVRVAYGTGRELEARTANVRRLNDALVGLPFLLPPWEERVRKAADLGDLAQLRRDLDRAPLDRGRQAARAEILVVAADEEGDGTGPTELDGERAHHVRLSIVDLSLSKVLLRLRRHVDPSFVSPKHRPVYAAGLDGCALAFDIYGTLAGR